MGAKVAVAIIHGIGSQMPPRSNDPSVLSFSAGLYRRLRRIFGRNLLRHEVAWAEVYWADILAERQTAFLDRIRRQTNYNGIRKFLVTGIADAAAIQERKGGENNAYDLVQERVRATMAHLKNEVDEGAPLIVMAHSFGSWIMSNTIWDHQTGRATAPTPFEGFATLQHLVTFGSNLPLFTFAYPPEALQPIARPARMWAGENWWTNFYDRDDALGFPLGPIGPAYEQLTQSGELRDVQISSGGIFTGWNPLSHEQYWTDRDFYRPVADILESTLRSTIE